MKPSGLQLVVVALLSALLVTIAPSQPVDAQGSFDQRLIELINDHRESIGVQPLATSASMSQGALDWSRHMATGATCGGNIPNWGHDPSYSWSSPSNPSGTLLASENIAFACGPAGYRFETGFTYPYLPSYCTSRLDYTTPEFFVCQWIDSAGHRRNLEHPGVNWIGSGSVQSRSDGLTMTFSTHRFVQANAPAPTPEPTDPGPEPQPSDVCMGQAVTVDLAQGDEPTAGDDVIAGTSGPDSIDGLGGDDVICGWGGDDTIRGGNGVDRIDGGWGDDLLFGFGGDDEILGNNGDDTIHGHRGHDVLSGGDGNDRIYGYADADLIDGGAGNDRLHGNYGNDVINGGPGNDSVFGYGDDDTLSGGEGDDILGGNFGNDRLNGNAGNDRVYGSDGQDVASGGVGNDRVDGNSGNDIVEGNSGNDILDGGVGSDNCDGGSGSDSQSRCEAVMSVP